MVRYQNSAYRQWGGNRWDCCAVNVCYRATIGTARLQHPGAALSMHWNERGEIELRWHTYASDISRLAPESDTVGESEVKGRFRFHMPHLAINLNFIQEMAVRH